MIRGRAFITRGAAPLGLPHTLARPSTSLRATLSLSKGRAPLAPARSVRVARSRSSLATRLGATPLGLDTRDVGQRVVKIALIVILGFTGLSAAQHPPLLAGSITGRVVEEGANTPLADALVTVTKSPVAGQLPEAPREAMTNGDGRYRFEQLTPGRYGVSVQRTGYASASPPNPSPSVVIDGDKPATELVIALPRGAVIAGRVLDANGQPRADVRVMAMRRAPGLPTGRLVSLGPFALTNDLGEFRIHSLAAGEYVVQATANTRWLPQSAKGQTRPSLVTVPTYYPGTIDAESAQPVTVAAGQTLTIEIGLQQAPTYSITGVVVDESGRPLANAGVTITPDRGSHLWMAGPATRARTEDDGSFTLDGLIGGVYVLNAAVPPAGGSITSYTYISSGQVKVVVNDHVTGLQLTAERP
jgi:carboxypeptidase family protein